MKKNKRKIIPVNYGIASSYDNFIEINVKLKGKLRKKILDHELRHVSGRYTKKDFYNDFNAKNSHFFESLIFALKNPEALINYFFVMYSYYGKFVTLNYTFIYPFIYFGIIWSLFWIIFFKVGIINVILGYFELVIIINTILLIYTHFYVKNHIIS